MTADFGGSGSGVNAVLLEHTGGEDEVGKDLTLTGHFDKGYGIVSSSGEGVHLESTGGGGKKGSEHKTSFTTAYGGDGKDGGSGGDLTATFSKSPSGGTGNVKPITSGIGHGLFLRTTGGDGGTGGEGYMVGFIKDGHGGDGGDGGQGGTVNISLLDGHAINQVGAGSGISVMSKGGAGGHGGEGKSGASGYGGTGGVGGDGGDITVNATGDNKIHTTADGYHGVVLISAAGDGGKGGDGVGGGAHAGNGGQGGTGGTIKATLKADITTDGKQAVGIHMLSLGGAGGSAGAGDGTFHSHGGESEGPGPGGNVTLTLSDSSVTTAGSESNGILLQSVGGFSGASGSTSGFVAYGASGHSGGDAGTVTATLSSVTVTTTGDHAAAFEAISVGGGGGKGSSTDGFDAMGGDGGAGGGGGAVTVDLTKSTFSTEGVNAIGVGVLSVGGGGGASGANGGVLTTGGAGGPGGDGGTADLSVDGVTVTTKGDSSMGVYVASIGAGGGNAHSPSGLIAIGGSGGDGGGGKDISLTGSGDGLSVTTEGKFADGVLLQSIGGGGGKGGGTFKINLGIGTTGVGSVGGDGGSGGNISFTGTDKDMIHTKGAQARGFVAQSVGGGGGAGGTVTDINIGLTFAGQTGASNGSHHHDGRAVKGSLGGSITTEGDSSTGVLLQSIGGGGGSAGTHTNIGVADVSFNHDMGADGGNGGDGGEVDLTSSAAITTSGHDADGILAQSIGGGGGHSSNLYSAGVGDLELSQQAGNVGAQGGAGGAGGTVAVTSKGKIVTAGDHSSGISAQSLGGGGGKAGSTISGLIGIDLASQVLGQTGGDGDAAGTVDVSSFGEIETKGSFAYAILAQSIGGGGGSGGTTIHGDISIASASYTHGGDGGSGGSGNTVTVTSEGDLTTTGDAAVGILAQSMGGGGGAGGLTVNGAASMASVNVAVGSDGGDGGFGGTVNVTNKGGVSTSGNLAAGVLAISQGGSGGKAGVLVNGSASMGEVSGAINVTLGGDGGKGGNAEKVTVANSGTVSTTGFGSAGLSALSIGGDGGAGGVVYAGTLNISAEGGGTFDLAIGGDGGDSGVGGAVEINNDGAITTSGHYADAIYAQSVGGNGGSGGSSYAVTASLSTGSNLQSTITVGGGGGGGAVGGDVSVTNTKTLTTTGGSADGIYAQSIGGNGGDGGSGIAFLGDFAIDKDKTFKVNANVHVGGSGGPGSDAGKVTIDNSGNISTKSGSSNGIFAQSVGGGGGDGGSAGSYSIGATKKPEDLEGSGFSLAVTMGGSGGGGGHGDDVTVSNSGQIQTAGDVSYGIFAQSVGGGGGTGGNGSPGLEGWAADIYELYEQINQALEVKEQYEDWKSLFEGFSVDIGGSAGQASDGGAVLVTNDGGIITTGADATAIYAQSVGGGGGSGGDGSQGLLNSATVTGSGSDGGDGGDVTVKNNKGIKTSGDRAMGIFAQSVGGGGGAAGDLESTIIASLDSFEQTLGVMAIGTAATGGGGDGGDVSISSDGSIVTSGDTAHGIFAQSVGGGGGGRGSYSSGVGGTDLKFEGEVGSEGAKGDSGAVSVDVSGTVSVSGDNAAGIFAQSAAGGDDSISGGVSISVSGTVTAGGKHGRAILAQTGESRTDAADSQTQGQVHVTIAKGATVSTTNADAYETIAILGGRNDNVTGSDSNNPDIKGNSITNVGTLTSANYSAVVIANDDAASLAIYNDGLMSGSIKLNDTKAHVLINDTAGVLAMGDSIDLGSSTSVKMYNYGTMSAHGVGEIGATTLRTKTGFSQSFYGTLLVDMTTDGATVAAPSADVLTVDFAGGTGKADFGSGSITPNWIGSNTLVNGDKGSVAILHTQNGGSIDISKVVLGGNAAVKYTLDPTQDSNTTLQLSYEVDYSGQATGATLGSRSLRFAEFFDAAMTAVRDASAQDDTSKALSQVGNRVLNAGSAAELEKIYGEHVLDESAVSAAGAISASRAMHGLLQSCPELDPNGAIPFYRQRECIWSQALGSKQNQGATNGNPGFDEVITGIALGGQHEIFDGTFVELAGQYENVSVKGSNFSQNGYRLSAGVALKHEIDNYTLSGTVSGGTYSYDHKRNYNLGGSINQALGDLDGRFLSAEARIAAVFEHNSFYAKPSAAISATQIWQDAMTENGAGGLNWQVDALSHTFVALRPSIEVGKSFKWSEQSAVVFLRAGLTAALTDPEITTTSRLVGSGSMFNDLTVASTSDRLLGEFEAGLNADLSDRLSLSLLGQTAFSENTSQFGGYARMKVRF
ncbi:autotransporter outer membrane beta-barrel domain-containing protein [Stappia indica]|uniref:autotransporter outer membrane beta-barrel domain-containing protein n=1 Tax=Stappia indica TaxID=538381 RepID=UPI001CD283B9|nr:autotransporter outer membrane beta-barrel domain-containing protein [Stappia indica]MCA1299407.1 autotransporter outer membrane beta-barrel domain-containing protein [Stappia indica]